MNLYDDLPEVGESESRNSGGSHTASKEDTQNSSTSTQANSPRTGENTKGGKPVVQKMKAMSWAQQRHASMLAVRRAAAAAPALTSSGNQPSVSMTPALLGSNAVGSTTTVSCW